MTFLPVALAFLFAGWAVVTSVRILYRGRYYRHLKPKSRPRRWVLFALLWLLAFCLLLWLPVSKLWPGSALERICTVVLLLPFCLFATVMRFGLDRYVDRYIEKRGYRLR